MKEISPRNSPKSCNVPKSVVSNLLLTTQGLHTNSNMKTTLKKISNTTIVSIRRNREVEATKQKSKTFLFQRLCQDIKKPLFLFIIFFKTKPLQKKFLFKNTEYNEGSRSEPPCQTNHQQQDQAQHFQKK